MRFPYSDDNKRYHTLSYHNRHTYGAKVHKAAIDAAFTCPNIDGSCGVGGCIYCSGGSGYFTEDCSLSVTEQFRREEKRIRAKYPDALITAYFQAHSNTYAPTDVLERLYREAISAGAHSLAVATRADCIDEEKAQLLASLGVPVTVELGLQTIHDSTAALINRCHTTIDFMRGYELLKAQGLRVCVHIINGLPSEDIPMMLKTADELGKLHPDGVKIHLMHVIDGTPLAEMYRRGEYQPMEKQDYIAAVVKQLELLPQTSVIERLTGDGDRNTLLAPTWSRDKISVLGGIDKLMAELDTWQGKSFINNITDRR